jgi:1,2-diacylglycerol 3-alpha-glucosyltransferase
MKVLITTEWYTPTVNGVVTSVLNLRSELIKLGHDVKILTLSDTKKSFEKDGVISIGSLGAGKIYPGARLSLRRDNKYIAELIRWQPDVVHSQSEFSTFLIARNIANKLEIPLVHTYHTVYENYTHYFSPVEKWGKAMAAVFTTATLKHADSVIAPTEKVRALLSGYGVEQEIYVAPTGIDLSKFHTQISDQEKENLRASLGIPKDNKILVAVGRMAKEKNLEEILRFQSKLHIPKITLLMVGDGPSRENLQKFADELGIADQVVFTGMVAPEKVGAYYQLGDVFVSASNSETQGLTYVEALANGVPILCRRDSCLTDVVKDGVNGWQYETFKEFQSKLNVLLHENKNELERKLIMDGVKEFSSANFGKKVEQIYYQTIENSLAKDGVQTLAEAV